MFGLQHVMRFYFFECCVICQKERDLVPHLRIDKVSVEGNVMSADLSSYFVYGGTQLVGDSACKRKKKKKKKKKLWMNFGVCKQERYESFL